MPKVVLFAFWGRKRCVELQLPLIRRVLRDNPNVTFEGWNLARNPADAAYLQSLEDEFCIRSDFYNHPDGWNAVWRHYAKPEYRDTLFVKIDDDMAFFEADRFGEFIALAASHPARITTAQVVNNGACTRHDPELQQRFSTLGVPLLDVHMSNEYARRCHEHFLERWEPLVGQPLEAVPCTDWLSINFIAFDWDVAKFIGDRVGGQSPLHIRGRDWPPYQILGDEGAANLCDVIVAKGYMAAHISFGPQSITDAQWDEWLTLYESVGTRYLEGL
jgi:hypothetical protein